MNDDARVGILAARRIVELELVPVEGSFDIEHLKEIHRRIFQDFPRLGFQDITPGQFRPSVPAGHDWYKNRTLESLSASLFVAYSPMDRKVIESLRKRLSQLDLAQLSQLKTVEFAAFISGLYADIDYIHPFNDGNSRTLRTFTRQLADRCGFDLDWSRFAKTLRGRDILYIARDISVNTRALPKLQDEGVKRDIVFTMDRLEDNPTLEELLKRIVRPHRAIAFETCSEKEAVQLFPELKPVYGMLHLAAKYHQQLEYDKNIAEQKLEAIRSQIQSQLDEGILPRQ